jgi:hypothetical protein
MAAPQEQVDRLMEMLSGKAPVAAIIGRIEEGPAGRIRVV